MDEKLRVILAYRGMAGLEVPHLQVGIGLPFAVVDVVPAARRNEERNRDHSP